MSVLIIIPARYGSSRYEGKPLVELKGATGVRKSLIQRSWEAAAAVPDARIVVATDDERIQSAAQEFGAEVVMTSTNARNGTERCSEALAKIDETFDIIVNLQGDAPLTPPWFVTALIEGLRAHPEADMTTPVLRCDPEHLAALKQDRANGRVGGTTAVFDHAGKALYFSKEVLPFADKGTPDVYHHVGVYAYRPQSLAKYITWPESEIERQEGLEQLRFLVNGGHVQCIEVDPKGRFFWEVNNAEDVAKVEASFAEAGII